VHALGCLCDYFAEQPQWYELTHPCLPPKHRSAMQPSACARSTTAKRCARRPPPAANTSLIID